MTNRNVTLYIAYEGTPEETEASAVQVFGSLDDMITWLKKKATKTKSLRKDKYLFDPEELRKIDFDRDSAFVELLNGPALTGKPTLWWNIITEKASALLGFA